MTANSTEADTELGAWRQSERGGLGRFVGREAGRGRRRFGWGDRQRQTKSGGTDNERVMKQEIGRPEKESHTRSTETHPEIRLNPKNFTCR